MSSNLIPRALQLEWYKIRDMLFGDNCASQNIPLALQMASSCQHPDARWLTEMCAGKGVKTKQDAKELFRQAKENDARALCFAWMFGARAFGDAPPTFEDAPTLLRRSAELGFAFAQALLAGRTQGKERFQFAQLAAAQGERDGLFWLGYCFSFGEGCEMDTNKAKENYLLASNCLNVWSMRNLGNLLDVNDPQVLLFVKKRVFANVHQSDGDGSDVRVRTGLERPSFCTPFRSRYSCSSLAAEALLSCLPSAKRCTIT